jgi:hypothetical protein
VILDKSDPGPPGYRIVTSFPTAGPCPAPPAPALGVLLQAYLHPDWLETDDDCWGVLARFIDVEPAAALEARSEFAALPGFVSDEELDGYLIDQLGSWWIPSGQDWTSREWLSALQLMLGGPVPSP